MDIQAMKIAFIEEFLKIQDEALVKKLVTTLQREKRESKQLSIDKFAGVLSDDDAKVFLGASQKCRKIGMNEC